MHAPKTKRSIGILALALLVGVMAVSPVVAGSADLLKDLNKGIKAKDAESVNQTLRQLASTGVDAKAIQKILNLAPKCAQLDVYEALADALASPADADAMGALAKAFKREKKTPIAFLLADALGRSGRADAVEPLANALTDKDDTIAAMAARSIAKIREPATVDKLIEALEDIEKARGRRRQQLEILGALRLVTGEDIQDALDWQNWWAAHKDSFTAPAAAEGNHSGKGGTVVDRLAKERPADLRTVEKLTKDDIVVVKGTSDKVEKVLKAIDMPHTLVRREDFDGVELDPKQVLILNCAGNKQLSEAGLEKIQKFVHQGGYLFSSDWELRNTLAKIFPEMLEFTKETPREDFEVGIYPTRPNASHPLLRDVFPLNPWTTTDDEGGMRWQIAGRSHQIKPLKGTIALIESPELGKKTGNPIVCITFQVSMGRVATGANPTQKVGSVLHVLSHFEKQTNEDGDGFALQQLLLNFILDKQEGRKRAE